MAGDTIITVIGSLTVDPEMRSMPPGTVVVSFTVASTPRILDRQASGRKDGGTLFICCSIWCDAAENVAESLTKGIHVIVQGRLVQCSCTTREGGNRTIVEMQVDGIGPSPRYAKAQVTRQPRDNGQGGFGGGQSGPQGGGFGGNRGGQGRYNQGGSQRGGYSGGGGFGGQDQSGYNAPVDGAADDPWTTGGSTSFDDEPPF